MFYLITTFFAFWIIHLRYGLTIGAIVLAMLFGSVIAIFLGPCGAVIGSIIWAILAAGQSDSGP